MSLTRKSLKAMGLTDEQIESVIEMHTETISGLKDKLDAVENNVETVEKLKADVEKYKGELETAKQTIADGEKYKDMYESQKAEYEKYKGNVTAKETKAAKEKAIKEYFKSKGINDDNMSIAMRGIKSEIDAAELDEKGKIKDIKVFDELIKGDYSKLVSRTETKGADVQIPPPNAGKTPITKDEIMNIRNTAERQQKIAENPELFGLPPMKG